MVALSHSVRMLTKYFTLEISNYKVAICSNRKYWQFIWRSGDSVVHSLVTYLAKFIKKIWKFLMFSGIWQTFYCCTAFTYCYLPSVSYHSLLVNYKYRKYNNFSSWFFVKIISQKCLLKDKVKKNIATAFLMDMHAHLSLQTRKMPIHMSVLISCHYQFYDF